MKSAPDISPEADPADTQDSRDDALHRGCMQSMKFWIDYYDTHEHWFLREMRWREQGRVS